MFLITVRDLQWRRRRFVIAIVGTSLVFAMALTIAGLSVGFDAEAQSAVSRLRASAWLVASGASGPFLGAVPMPTATAVAAVKVPGIHAAGPIVYGRKTLGSGVGAKDINVLGAQPGGPGMPTTSSGRPPAVPGEVALSTKVKGSHPIGSQVVIAGHPFTVVGRVPNATALSGVPFVYVTLPDAQRLVFGATSGASAIAIVGTPTGPLPTGATLESNHDAVNDLERPLQPAHKAISLMAVLLFVVAALIVGSLVYLSALERQRDFAVLKATGVSTASILGGLAIQAVMMSVGAAIVALGLSAVIVPFFPIPVVVTGLFRALLPVIGVLVGLLASCLAIRRATSVDPALAFGGP